MEVKTIKCKLRIEMDFGSGMLWQFDFGKLRRKWMSVQLCIQFKWYTYKDHLELDGLFNIQNPFGIHTPFFLYEANDESSDGK